jgi:ribosome-associated protein
MARKLKKGYFVSGHFVAEGSELDLELKRELKGGDAPSRTELKRESTELQKLGTDLLGLGQDPIERLGLPDKLREALAEARKITNFEGKRRQMQFVGKLMRQLEAPELERIRAALAEQGRGPASDTLALHQTEQWRDRLIADDDAFGAWITQYPATDGQQLRALIRQSRKDALPSKAGETPRHGKAYRELFQMVRDQMTAIPDNIDSLASHVRPGSLT